MEAKQINPELRKILDTFDEVLAQDTVLSGQLWDVLSALRGPDDMDADVYIKATTTNHIRVTAFPKMAALEKSNIFPRNNSAIKRVCLSTRPIDTDFSSTELKSRSSHFANHIMRAFRALGLKD